MKLLLAATLCAPLLLAAADTKPKADLEAATRLQVFLDRANFGPGKIDGHFGAFTQHALHLYREAKGLPPLSAPPEPADKEKKDDKTKSATAPLPDLADMDLASVGSPFTDYTVTEEDLKEVGDFPEKIEAQAKLKWLPYRSPAEAIAEKFHCDVDFLTQLNPDTPLDKLTVGKKLTVPNVEPFLIEPLKPKEPEKAANKKGSNDNDTDDEKDEKAAIKEAAEVAEKISVKVDTANNMLTVLDEGKITAAYPVTIGSSETASPLGEWKVRGTAKLPHFRYDEKMLKEGTRSKDFQLLPPGPNNLVGVVWIALNKKGIGIHGTAEPDSIGRSVSHGCIRLANWDITRLAEKVRPNVKVSIH